MWYDVGLVLNDDPGRSELGYAIVTETKAGYGNIYYVDFSKQIVNKIES